jgi:signal peptidase I
LIWNGKLINLGVYKNIEDAYMMELKVPKGHYYLIGDNLDKSDDSRRFGSVEEKDILYKVIL